MVQDAWSVGQASICPPLCQLTITYATMAQQLPMPISSHTPLSGPTKAATRRDTQPGRCRLLYKAHRVNRFQGAGIWQRLAGGLAVAELWLLFVSPLNTHSPLIILIIPSSTLLLFSVGRQMSVWVSVVNGLRIIFRHNLSGLCFICQSKEPYTQLSERKGLNLLDSDDCYTQSEECRVDKKNVFQILVNLV